MQGVKIVLTHPHFWPLACWFFFSYAIFFSFIGLWGGPFLIQVYDLSKTKSGNILSMSAIGMIWGSPILSYLSNNIFKARKPVLILSSILTLIITGPLYIFTQGIPIALLYLICLGIGTFLGAVTTIGFTTNKELFPVSIAGTATELVNFFPFLGSYISDHIGRCIGQSGNHHIGRFFPSEIQIFISGALSLRAGSLHLQLPCEGNHEDKIDAELQRRRIILKIGKPNMK